jgi:phosphate starvation-inducible PhoH-like protein
LESQHNSPATVTQVTLAPENPRRLSALCGLANEHLIHIESRLGVKITNHGNQFVVTGPEALCQSVSLMLERLYRETQNNGDVTPDMVHLYLQEMIVQEPGVLPEPTIPVYDEEQISVIQTPKVMVKPRGTNQKKYVHAILNHDINFGIGPAGTGKTFLAVACAVMALKQEKVRRILLVRPAVEAGEKLGFLPGDLSQKVDPYLRPLYDALYEMLGFEPVDKLIEKNVIEIAPLAYMRGRTLSNAFIILDESQNTTEEQMKMFLTRIGFGSTAVITGDPTQVDLPRGTKSGLVHASKVLNNVPGISFTHFTSGDVVRHPLVQRIVDAYEQYQEGEQPS